MVATALLLAFCVGAAAVYLYIVQRRKDCAEKYLHLRCRDCGQKVRYLAVKAGRSALCPRCRQTMTLPRAAQAVPPTVYSSDGYEMRVGKRRVSPRMLAASAGR